MINSILSWRFISTFNLAVFFIQSIDRNFEFWNKLTASFQSAIRKIDVVQIIILDLFATKPQFKKSLRRPKRGFC
jgi:hypothetical protein